MFEANVKKGEVNVKKGEVEKSAIAEHAWNHGHQIDWDSVKALDHQPHPWSRKLLESWHIHLQQPKMNRDKGMLPSLYLPLLQRTSKSTAKKKQ